MSAVTAHTRTAQAPLFGNGARQLRVQGLRTLNRKRKDLLSCVLVSARVPPGLKTCLQSFGHQVCKLCENENSANKVLTACQLISRKEPTGHATTLKPKRQTLSPQQSTLQQNTE